MERVRRAYGEVAARYIDLFARTSEMHPDDVELITRHLSSGSGAVLDVGCGPGQLTAHLRASGVEATGIDVVPEFLDHARAVDPDGRYVRASMAQLPVPDGSVTGVLAWYSLIHLHPDELDEVLDELRRVVAPGAVLVVGCFDGERLDAFDHQVLTAYRWPVDELATRLRRAGFAELERQQRPGVDRVGARPHAAIVATAD